MFDSFLVRIRIVGCFLLYFTRSVIYIYIFFIFLEKGITDYSDTSFISGSFNWKGQCYDIVDLWFFRQSNLSWALELCGLKYFYVDFAVQFYIFRNIKLLGTTFFEIIILFTRITARANGARNIHIEWKQDSHWCLQCSINFIVLSL